MTDVWVGGKRIRLDPSKAIGKGGEADVFDIGDALKVFKHANHPDLVGLPHEQKAAKARLAMHQQKLREFPTNLPATVVAPKQLATDQTGATILGYTMPLLRGAEVLIRWSDRTFRQAVDPDDVFTIFTNLHATVGGIHRAPAVIGDFNDLNILVDHANIAHVIDADSFQFGRFPCTTFTTKFVDPLLCDPTASAPMLTSAHTTDSDWYAFAVMLMQSLLFVDPYGGMYRPKNPADRIPHQARSLHRITILHSEVKYPGPAIPYDYLPDELLHEFSSIFEKDKRGVFPATLLQQRWTTCTTCGTRHLRTTCPVCQTGAATVTRQVTTIRGNVMATRMFKTNGTIVCAASLNGAVNWLAHDKDEFRRENDELVLRGPMNPKMRIRLAGRKTVFAANGRAVVVAQDSQTTVAVDEYQGFAMIDGNDSHFYWIQQGQLNHDGRFGPQYIGDVLRDQTLFWVGSSFGCGFYRAGELSRFFVFDAENRGMVDVTGVPRIRGQLVDATCTFSSRYAWLITATQEQGRRIHRCAVISATGEVVATADAEAGEDSWLGTFRGKAATGSGLMVPTDDGIISVAVDHLSRSIQKAQEFPDTAPWVDSGSLLFPGHDGLYVVNPQDVTRLQIRQATP